MSHHYKCATRRPGGQRGKYGCKEDRYQKAQPRDYGCDTCSTAFGYPCTTLDECCHRRASEQGADGNEEGICAVGQRGTWEVSVLLIDHATETHHGIERGGSVNDVHVEKRKDGEDKMRSGVIEGPIDLIQCPVYWVPCDDLFEELESRIACLGIWKVSDRCATTLFGNQGRKGVSLRRLDWNKNLRHGRWKLELTATRLPIPEQYQR